MPGTMMITVARPSGYAGVRRVEVSLPLVAALLEPPSRYRLPTDAPLPAEPRRSRGPNMQTMIRMALERDRMRR